MASERLQKILARAGFGSRRACEEFILQGRVEVDGKAVTELGSKADALTQEICLDGEPVLAQRSAYYLLYKPSGYICSLRAERGRRRAVDLINDPRRLYTVGRLDEDSEGLIVVTNDGELTQKLTHPRYAVPKEYLVAIDGRMPPAVLAKLRAGVYLAEGRTAPAEVTPPRKGRRAELTVKITEGLNRQVRRMLSAVGLKVRRLVRRRIGPLEVGKLKPGGYRRLSSTEVRALLAAADGGAKKKPPKRTPRPAASRKAPPKESKSKKNQKKRGKRDEGRAESRGESRGAKRGEKRGGKRGESRGGKRGESRGGKRGESRGAKRGESRGGKRGESRGAKRGESRGAKRGENRGPKRGEKRGAKRGGKRR